MIKGRRLTLTFHAIDDGGPLDGLLLRLHHRFSILLDDLLHRFFSPLRESARTFSCPLGVECDPLHLLLLLLECVMKKIV